jgi:hypothetical protein
MQKNLVSLICTLTLLAFLMPAMVAEDSLNATANATINETQNATNIALNATANLTTSQAPAAIQLGSGKELSHSKVLRAGFAKTKAVNNLDVYGNKSTYNIPYSTSQNAPFDASSRLGNVSQFTYNTDNYKPLYNISQYSRTKPVYEVPGTVSSKAVYSISGYPNIKTVNSIP